MADLHLFGHWERDEETGEPGPNGQKVHAFLMGEDIDMTPEMQAYVRMEFSAQEAYRLNMQRKLTALVVRLQNLGAQDIGGLETPTTPEEAYKRGQRDGAYRRTTECAQMVADILNDVAVSVG